MIRPSYPFSFQEFRAAGSCGSVPGDVAISIAKKASRDVLRTADTDDDDEKDDDGDRHELSGELQVTGLKEIRTRTGLQVGNCLRGTCLDSCCLDVHS